jgi:RNA recognition motif-containing protein
MGRLGLIAVTNIYVGNLPFSLTEADLRLLFEQHGQVSKANLVMDRETGRPRGFGFVEMPDDHQAQSAINALNGSTQGGRPLVVNVAKPREQGAGGGGFRRSGGGGGGGGGFRRGGGGGW